MAVVTMPALILSLQLLLLATGAQSAGILTVSNNCKYKVWPALFGSEGGNPPATGFALAPGESKAMQLPPGWIGRVWARTACSADPATFKFSCATGDCPSGFTECFGKDASQPATVVEFKLNGGSGLDIFHVNVAGGFNVPVEVVPEVLPGGNGNVANCMVSNCPVDLNRACPEQLAVHEGGGVVACKSGCLAFERAEDCCTGEHSTADTCPEPLYAKLFKGLCPKAFTYAFDGATSDFTCAAGSTNYHVNFCPTAGSGDMSSASRSALTWFLKEMFK